jgi:hypothetical protein
MDCASVPPGLLTLASERLGCVAAATASAVAATRLKARACAGGEHLVFDYLSLES